MTPPPRHQHPRCFHYSIVIATCIMIIIPTFSFSRSVRSCSYNYTFFIPCTPSQAARVTNAGKYLKGVGLEVRTRPYVYENTSFIELDSLLSYLQTTRLRVGVALSLIIDCTLQK